MRVDERRERQIGRHQHLMLMLFLWSTQSVFGGARLGGTIEDFQAGWDRPTSDERVERTARLAWGPFDQQTNLPPVARQASADFLDGVACSVWLKGRRGVNENWDWVVKRIREVVPDCPKKAHPTAAKFCGG